MKKIKASGAHARHVHKKQPSGNKRFLCLEQSGDSPRIPHSNITRYQITCTVLRVVYCLSVSINLSAGLLFWELVCACVYLDNGGGA